MNKNIAPKRIILMYISEVSGHHSATLAIEKALRISAPDTEILNINAFNYTNPISEKVINRLYMGVIKMTPQIWQYLYDNPKIAKRLERIKGLIHKFNSPKLKNLFDKVKPDIVICTQAFPCGMVADFKANYGFALKLVAVLTDYIPHAYWVYDQVDYYITPSEEVSQQLIKKGVEPNKIKSFGIPFDPKFNNGFSRDAILEKLGLKDSVPIVLIMGGGQGLGPIKTIVKSLEKVKRDIQEIIVSGTNKKLYKWLCKKTRKYKKKIMALGYTDNIHELMSVADLIITKPGGITTAEALTKKLAMIIIRPIPGQEASNTAYLTEKMAALKVDEPKKINVIIEGLLNDPVKLSLLRESCGRVSKPNAV
jgi:processive 1,2-diacylglycerol beta-glucosyltransferase